MHPTIPQHARPSCAYKVGVISCIILLQRERSDLSSIMSGRGGGGTAATSGRSPAASRQPSKPPSSPTPSAAAGGEIMSAGADRRLLLYVRSRTCFPAREHPSLLRCWVPTTRASTRTLSGNGLEEPFNANGDCTIYAIQLYVLSTCQTCGLIRTFVSHVRTPNKFVEARPLRQTIRSSMASTPFN